MSPSRRKKSTRRTKEQLLQELEVTQRLLIEKEEELVICQEELARHIQQPAGKNKPEGTNQDEIDALQGELSVLQTSMDVTAEQLAQLQEDSSAQALQLAKKDETIEKLEQQLTTLKRKLDAAEATSGTPATQDSKAQLPALVVVEQEDEASATTNTQVAQPATKQPVTAQPRPINKETYTVPIQIAPITQLVKQDVPFDAAINIDLRTVEGNDIKHLRCRARLFAKRLVDGWSSQIGETETAYDAGQKATATIKDAMLPAGLYQLQAVAAFTTETGTPLPIVSIHEGELLQVIV